MPEQDGIVFRLALGDLEPGQVILDLAAGCALVDQVEAAVFVTITHAGEAVTNKS